MADMPILCPTPGRNTPVPDHNIDFEIDEPLRDILSAPSLLSPLPCSPPHSSNSHTKPDITQMCKIAVACILPTTQMDLDISDSDNSSDNRDTSSPNTDQEEVQDIVREIELKLLEDTTTTSDVQTIPW